MDTAINGKPMLSTPLHWRDIPACIYCGRLLLATNKDNPPVVTSDYLHSDPILCDYVLIHRECLVPYHQTVRAQFIERYGARVK